MSKRGKAAECGCLRRERTKRPLKPLILIVGEGKRTERHYFDGVKKVDATAKRFRIIVKGANGGAPDQVVQAAIGHRDRGVEKGEESRFDQVWCVIDVEGLPNQAKLQEAAKLARKENISLCLSNPAFEVWLLAHFERTCKLFANCDAVVRDLNKHWQRHCGCEYAKNDEKVFGRVRKRTDTAIANARSVHEQDHDQKPIADSNSSTDVYRLVERLLHPNRDDRQDASSS